MGQRGVKKIEHRRAGPYEVIPRNDQANIQRCRNFVIVRHCSYSDRPSRRALRNVTGFERAMQTARALFQIEREIRAEQAGHGKPLDVVLSETETCVSLYSTIIRRWNLQREIDTKIANEGVSDAANIQ